MTLCLISAKWIETEVKIPHNSFIMMRNFNWFQTESVGRSIILSRLNYCNSLLAGATSGGLNRLHRIQIQVARSVTSLPQRTHAQPTLTSLHWLPVAYVSAYYTKWQSQYSPHYVINNRSTLPENYSVIGRYETTIQHGPVRNDSSSYSYKVCRV